MQIHGRDAQAFQSAASAESDHPDTVSRAGTTRVAEKRRNSNSLDVSHLAGASQSTVSRALRSEPMICALTRERIGEFADQLNHHFDESAWSLRRQHTGTVTGLFFEVVRESRGGASYPTAAAILS